MARRIAVIGGGPAGLAAAHRLQREGWSVHVFERAARVGGLARTEVLWGHAIDLGTHIIVGDDSAAGALMDDILGADVRTLPLRRGIVLRGRLLDYPLRPIPSLAALGLKESARAAVSLVAARLRPTSDAPSAEAWVTRRYGRRLYDAIARPHIEKLWGRPGSDVDESFVRSLDDVRHKTPTSFRYPTRGIAVICDRLAARIEQHGTVSLGASIARIQPLEGGAADLTVDGQTLRFDGVVSAIPIAALLRLLGIAPDPAAPHPTRHIAVVQLLVRSSARITPLWVMTPDLDVAVGRVSDSRAWGMTAADSTEAIITMEYWCGDGDAIWTDSDAAAATRASRELHATRLLPGVVVRETRVTRLPHALPVPAIGVRERVERSRQAATARGVESVGRHGRATYDSVLSAMADGMCGAERLIARLSAG